jgi:lipoyl(octanoyl) transferase
MTQAPSAPVVRTLGRVDYVATWEAMRVFTEQRIATTPDELWVVEHAPVFTLGQAGKRDHLLEPGEIPVVASDRGGQVTFHGPGQVVVYALVDLRRLGIYVKELVFRIEQAVVQTLAACGVDGRRVRGAPGVYVPWPASRAAGELTGLAKIAALGIKVTRGCSYHGVALNVAMDLAPFSCINPCGYAGLPTVDLATLGSTVTWQQAADLLADRLAHHLAPRLNAALPDPAPIDVA